MRLAFLPLLALTLLLTCNTQKVILQSDKSDKLPLEKISIISGTDTTVRTLNGALLKISANSFSVDSGTTVQLEIQEAYSISQLVASGNLRTQTSTGEPLSSDGMIFINAVAGETVRIKEAIGVSIPTRSRNPDMQVYKGEKDANGNIVWKEPRPLFQQNERDVSYGTNTLFQSHCAGCHLLGKDFVGPDLAHLGKRLGFEGGQPIYSLIRHMNDYPQKESKDFIPADTSNYLGFDKDYYSLSTYRCNLQEIFGVTGTPFPSLTEKEIDDLVIFIQEESEKRNLPFPSHTYLYDCIDSCTVYKSGLVELDNAKQNRSLMIQKNGAMVKELKENSLPPPTVEIETLPSPEENNRVKPEENASVYYQFSIETFGWYNIDILLKDVNGVKDSELFIRLQGEYRQKVEVFLIIPSHKVYAEGGRTGRSPDEFAFELKNGQIALPQNSIAYILAMTEIEQGIAYSLKSFTTSTRQSLDLELKLSTKEELNSALEILNTGGLKISAGESQNAEKIREADAEINRLEGLRNELERYKPKNCDCECGIATDSIKKGSGR